MTTTPQTTRQTTLQSTLQPPAASLLDAGRRAWAALEALHMPGYFSRATRDELARLGLHGRDGYVASRSAALGVVPAEVVQATFYVFAPAQVARAVPACWRLATPEQVLAARLRGVGQTLHTVLDPLLAQEPHAAALTEANELAARACAALSVPGRPLHAAHAALPWPDDPLLRLWHAATLLREFRGDGHLAVLVAGGVGPLEAALTAALSGGHPLGFQRKTRGWTDAEWDAAAGQLLDAGLVHRTAGDGPLCERVALTAAGVAWRGDVEHRTDLAGVAGWAALGEPGTRRLAELLEPWVRAVVESGVLRPAGVRPAGGGPTGPRV